MTNQNLGLAGFGPFIDPQSGPVDFGPYIDPNGFGPFIDPDG